MNEVLSQPDLSSQYINILEKTNQQLGLWSNPYGVSIMILSVWITIIAIVVAYLIYKQGADYKNKLESDRKESNKKIAELYEQQTEILNKQKLAIEKQTAILEENQKIKQGLDAEIEKQLQDYKEQLKSAGDTEKSKIEKSIKELSKEKFKLHSNAVIEPFQINDSPMSKLNNFGIASNFHSCSKCNYGFLVNNGDFFKSSEVSFMGGSKGVRCPSCGNIDKLWSL